MSLLPSCVAQQSFSYTSAPQYLMPCLALLPKYLLYALQINNNMWSAHVLGHSIVELPLENCCMGR